MMNIETLCSFCYKVLFLLQWPLDRILEFLLDLVTKDNRIERILCDFTISDLFISGKTFDKVSRNNLNATQIFALTKHTLDYGGALCSDIDYRRQIVFDESITIDTAVKALSESLKVKSQYISLLRDFVMRIRNAETHKKALRSDQTSPVSAENSAHIDLLNQMWQYLMDSTPPSVDSTSAWRDLGFQSTPLNDFRGMGLLALKSHVYFSKFHQTRAKETLVHSHNPGLWFPYATTGINVGSWLAQFMELGLLNCFLFDSSCEPLEVFGVLFSYFFLDFSRFWQICRPKDIMQFGEISRKFKQNTKTFLEDLNQNGFAHHSSVAGHCDGGQEMLAEIERWIDGKQVIGRKFY